MERQAPAKAPQTGAEARAIIAEWRVKTSKRAARRFCHVAIYQGLSNWTDEARKEWVAFYVELNP